MNLQEAKHLLEKSLALRLPLMLWGPPGVGKSSLVAQTAAQLGLEVRDLRLAQLDATDLRGIPVPDHKTKRLRWYAPSFLPSEGEGILFMDEIDKAPTLVKNAALELVLDRRLGDYRLPEGWRMVCAGNREEDDAFSSPLGAALANRMLHADIDADLDTWISWAQENSVHEDIIAFLRFRTELLCKATGEHAFPSPRSWASASRLWDLALKENGKVSETAKSRWIAAAVGPGTAAEFLAWSKVYRNINVRDIFKGKLPEFKPEDASLRYAVVLAVANHLRRQGFTEDDGPHLASLLNAVTPELRVLLFKSLPNELVKKIAIHPALRSIASQLVLSYVG